jgi:type IV pilus assembly protein PilE
MPANRIPRCCAADTSWISDASGFTLIELLIVLQIIGILLLVALPTYLGFRDRAAKRAAGANVREALPAAEQFGNEHNFSYNGMTIAGLKAIDSGLSGTLLVKSATATNYCLTSTVRGWKAYAKGPGGTATLTVVC